MKNFYLVWRHCLLMVLGCFICLSGFAQLSLLEQGKVYRFVNRMYPGYSMTAGSMTTAIGAATVESSKSQLWYVAEVSNDGGGVPRYRLRSFGNGRYLQGAGQSTQWKLVENSTTANTYLYLRTVGTTYNTLSLDNTDNNRNKMHCDASKNIVGWSVDGQATHWTITEVDFTADAIEANWAAIDNFVFTDTQITNFKASLAAIFTDAACTTLNATYAAMSLSELQADANYTALPATLQNMVTKVWNEQTSTQDRATAWGEDHVDGEPAKAWSGDYAKRYRVQNYEIYTNRDCVNSALKINIHTNLNNPTGIITKERDALYIMVDGEIKEGASLYLGSYSGHGQAGNATDGVQLHTGLNVVPCFVDKQWTCIYYTANTMKAWDGATNKGAHPLSFYPDLKIHIEGGHVNGYYNEVGDALYAHGRTGENVTPTGDNEEDWDYLAARNVLDDITIVGKRIVFQFNFRDPVTESGATCKGTEYYFTADAEGNRRVRITDFLERWNRIVWAQNLTMGLESAESVAAANALYPTLDDRTRGVYAYTGKDSEYASSYEDYYRMHCLAIGIPTGYMSGGWTSSNYNYGTFQAIIEGITTNAGNTWGPGHEIGHQHQGPINTAGLTEVTNNLFANICVWYDGRATSRTNSGEGDLSYVLKAYNEENSDFFTNNIWAQTQMYYKLWLYYHLVGHNNKFYPRLFEMLRRDPIQRNYNQLDVQEVENGTKVTGKTPLLHFYKKCCLAAGEDLTEFFRAYGFFTPMNKRYVGDYASAEYTQTQAQIDATIAEVKALGYPENHTVLFINDCTGTPFYQHDGTTERSRLGESGTYSDLGAYTDYNGTTSNDEVTGTYELTVANGNATMVGATGGAGFLIYDGNGKLLSFSSDYTFPLSDEALIAIAKGTATVQVLNAEGASTPVVYDGGSAAVSLLAGLLDEVKVVVDAVDDGGNSGTDYTKVGFYKKSEVATLLSLYEEAKTLYEEGAQSGYVSAYKALKAEFDAVKANEFARVALVAGSTCVLVNKEVPTRYISETGSNTVTTTNVTDGVVVANVPATGQWILEASTTSGAYNFKNVSTTNYWLALSGNTQLTTGAEKKSYTFLDNEDGSWGIKYSENKQLIHKAGGNNIVGWGDTSNKNSHWYITMVSKPEVLEASMNLEDLVAKTTTLMNKMANVSGKGAQDMSTFRITSNATEQGHGTALMVDGDLNTFFHTVWSGTEVNENHYFQIDCGEGLSLEEFTFNYTTRPAGDGGKDAPTQFVITGGNNTDANGDVTDWTPITTISEGLPSEKATSYTSGTIGTLGTAYRYLRFTVPTASGGTFGGQYYFGIAELGISRPEAQVNSIVAKYAADALGGNQLTNAKLIAADDALYASKQLLANGEATADELTAKYTALKTQYDILLATYNAAENADLTAAQTALQQVINNTQTLLNECGSVSIVKANVPLQSTDEDASGYLYCNAPYQARQNGDYSVQGTDGYHLLDGNKATYLHTNYAANAGPGEDHYLRVYVGESGIGQFRMLYTTRNSGDGQPTKMVIEGSNEATGTYTEIATLTKDDVSNPLPVTNGTDYTSVYFEGGTYKYLRFRMLGNTSNNGKPDGHYWFCMAEFALERKASTTITNNHVGTVMDDEILTTYNAIESATTAKNLATTVDQLTAAQTALQAQYDALLAAKNSVSTAGLEAAVASLRSLYESCFSDDACTTIKDKYNGSINLTQPLLEEVNNAITTAQTLIDATLHTEEQVNEQQAAIEAMQERLGTAIAYAALPVKLSTDEEKVYYSITINRSGTPVLEYGGVNGENNKLKVTGSGFQYGNNLQAFYFTKGTTAPQVLIHTKSNDYILTTSSLAQGDGKVAGVDPATEESELSSKEWIIEANRSSDWYNIRPIPLDGSATNLYMSNIYGVSKNIGFYTDANDGGSCFQFTPQTDWDKSEAYYLLYNYFHDETKVEIDMTAEPPAFPADKIHDTAIGYYRSSLASNYLSAYVHAYFYLEYGGEDSYLTAAYEALVAANEALVTNAIDFDAYYVLRNAHTGYCNNAVAYANVNDHKVYWHAQAAEVETTYNVDTNSGTVGSGNYFNTWTSTETPQVTFKNEYNNMQVSGSNLVIYSGGSSAPFKLNAPSGYVIDSYSVTFANNGHNNEQTLTFSDEGAVYKTTSASQTYTVENSGKSSVTINLTGSNNGVVLTNFTVKIRPSFTENEAVNVWKFEQAENGNVYLKNLHTGTYLTNESDGQYKGRQLSTTAQPVTFVVLGDEQLNIKLNNGYPLHAQNDGKAVVSYPGGKNSASAWYVEKVATPEEITTRITMTQYQKASLYLAYPAIIPDGITAYYAASEADATIEGTSGGSIYLTPFEGDVLPAGTPVILKGAQGAYKFDLSTTDEGTSPASNLFKGSAYKKLVQGETNYKYYLFGVKTVNGEKKVGLYWAWLEYLADGTISNAGTDDGHHFYVPANKIYLPWNTTANGAAPAFYFNFDGTTTGVDGIENVWDRNTGIYDLQGRRVNRIEQSGIYVINGQKRFVKVNGR